MGRDGPGLEDRYYFFFLCRPNDFI